MNKLWYLISLCGSLNLLLALHWRGSWSFYPLLFTFVLLPLLELFLPVASGNLTEEQEASRKNDFYFDFILWMSVPFQFILLFIYLQTLQTTPLTTSELVGLTIAMGLSCGVLGINAAHELGHRATPHEQVMARMLLSTSWYWHFTIEHNKGHHKNVATPIDPETSRLNESVYRFWIRSIVYSFLSAWHIEEQNAKREGYSAWSVKNEMILALILQMFFTLLIYWYFGTLALVGFLCSALIGILLLETVNYIEHYGLNRKEIAPGRFEKVQPYHSWNADHPISRFFLFDLSRHSDHHYNAARKYQILRHHEDSLQMPTGYPGMMLLCLIPRLWFRVMNPKVMKAKCHS
jgi:alkane 1-monooxygenase